MLHIEALLAQAVLECELGCHRAKAAAEGVGGPQEPQGVCPGSYVAVHLADVPAVVVLKLQQQVEASSQARAASLPTQKLCQLAVGFCVYTWQASLVEYGL